MIKDYEYLLQEDPAYREKASCISRICKDIAEILSGEDLRDLRNSRTHYPSIAFHSPCSLQHGERLHGVVEELLTSLGYRLTGVPNDHLCCGSAGTYSLLQPKLSDQLRKQKLDALYSGGPSIIATANIGCLTHLSDKAGCPSCIGSNSWLRANNFVFFLRFIS